MQLSLVPGKIEPLEKFLTYMIKEGGDLKQQIEVLSWPSEQIKGMIIDNKLTANPTPEVSEILGNLLQTSKLQVRNSSDPTTDQASFYTNASLRMDLKPSECLIIEGVFETSTLSAIETGMGVAISRPQDLNWLLTNELLPKYGREPFDVASYLASVYRPGEVSIIGITGRNGVGKTERTEKIVDIGRKEGLPINILPFDAFHIRSRSERKIWLGEVRDSSPEEYLQRYDEDTWFDWDKIKESLLTLRNKHPVTINNVYDKQDNGEMTGTVDIPIDPKKGCIVIIEGISVAHLGSLLDDVIYLTTHPKKRMERLVEREKAFFQSPKELADRLRLYAHYDSRHLLVQQANVTKVLGNEGENLIPLPLIVPLL